MKRLTLRTVLVLAGTVLLGCSTVPKEKFKNDLAELSQAENLKMTGLASVPDPDRKLAEIYRASLRDEKVQEGLYDEALRTGRAWSSEAILDTSWFRLFIHRGLPKISPEDKDFLLHLIVANLETMPVGDCAQFHQGALQLKLGSTIRIAPADKERFYKMFARVLQAGALAGPSAPSQKEREDFSVAVVALFAKAKERLSDDEIASVMLPLAAGIVTSEEQHCKTSKVLSALLLQLEPKYRNRIFDFWVKQPL